MITSQVPIPIIENAIHEVCIELAEKNHQTLSWTEMEEENLWRELVSCILGSRVRYETAFSALKRMEFLGLLCKPDDSLDFDKLEQKILKALTGKLPNVCNGISKSCYPFFRTRANQIKRAAEYLYCESKSIKDFMYEMYDFRMARRRLASEVSGLGPKQASLFLRNIGYSNEVAVLDVHILTYMNWIGLTDTLVKSIPTINKYEVLEKEFIDHSYSYGYSPDHFDLAVWVVVKTVKDEYRWQ